MVHYNLERLDVVFGALADPTRRAVLTSLRGGERSIGELAAPFEMSLTGFIKHLAILEDAKLIARRKTGRVVSCRLTGSGMKSAIEWLQRYEEFWNAQLDRLDIFLDKEGSGAWTQPLTKAPASRSAGSSTPRSPRSTRRGRTRSK